MSSPSILSAVAASKRPIRLPFKSNLPKYSTRDDADVIVGDPGPSTTSSLRTRQLSQIERTTCGICHKKQSKYVCPRCNVFYCSLDCFRGQAHAQCSEPFYAASVREALTSSSDEISMASEEKRKMLEMLQRFETSSGQQGDLESVVPQLGELLDGARNEDGSVDEAKLEALERALGLDLKGLQRMLAEEDGANGLDEEEDGEENELLNALEGLDVDMADPEAIFNKLPPRYRERFMTMLENPHDSEARQLMEELEIDLSQAANEPWWISAHEDLDGDGNPVGMIIPPPINAVDAGNLRVTEKVAQNLIYNLVAVFLTYAWLVTREGLFSLEDLWTDPSIKDDPEIQVTVTRDILNDLRRAVAFVFDQKSTIRYASIRQIWDDLSTATAPASPSSDSVETKLDPILLMTIRDLLLPPLDLELASGLSRALGDLYRFFGYLVDSATALGLSKKEITAIQAGRKKLIFFSGAAAAAPRTAWQKVTTEVETLKEQLDVEREFVEEADKIDEKTNVHSFTPEQPERETARIEEID